MSAFTALNVEPDDTFDEDVDNTRELQIEEALKLYQTALKLHAQGSQYYDQAAASYEALFKSEIFRYPESITDFTRSENLQADIEPYFLFPIGTDLVSAGSDGSANTLPQILYLAYKNHGQFIIDCLKHQLKQGYNIPKEHLLPQAQVALHQFCQALARDESDTELWRKTARIGALLGSRAIARYCLEAAVEVDDDPTQGEVEPAIIEEGFAGMQLREHLEVLSDKVALSHPIMAPYNKKALSTILKKYVDPYPFLPANSSATLDGTPETQEPRIIVKLPERSWCGLGDALWRACLLHEGSGTSTFITMPDGDNEMKEAATSPEDSASRPLVLLTDSTASILQAEPASSGAINPLNPVFLDIRKDDDPQAGPSSSGSNDKIAEQESSSLGARKRSQSVAGIQEAPDEEAGAQKRSKRIRNRDTTTDASPPDLTTQFKEQLHEVNQADEHTFNYINSLLQKFGIRDLGSIDELQEAMSPNTTRYQDDAICNTAVRDLRDVMHSWNDNRAAVLMSGGGLDIIATSNGGANAGILAFLEHSKISPKRASELPAFSAKVGLASFVESVNERFLPLQDVAYEFLKIVHPSYTQNLWPELFKHTIVRLVNRLDADIFRRIQDEVGHLQSIDDSEELIVLKNLVQMLFEIHLDIYASITDPNSAIDFATRIKEKDSVERWRTFTSDLVAGSIGDPKDGQIDDLTLRYLWSSVFFASMADGTSREHVISCWTDLQKLLDEAGNRTIELQNNAVMPDISASAAEREISRLTSMDFFLGLFQSDESDSLAIIETLEPVLDPSSTGVSDATETSGSPKNTEISPEPGGNTAPTVPTGLRDMWKFLEGGSTSLRLFLWQRLREAYQAINYTTKVFSCHLKSLEIIVSDLRSTAYVDGSVESRQQSLLSWFKTLDDLLVKALTLALNDPAAFEIIDDAHFKTSAAEVAQLCRLLHSAAIFDDGVRVGTIQLPRNTPAYSPQGTFGTALIKLREMQVRSWALLYTLIKDGMSQNRELFPAMDSDLADYMAAVHYSLGLRKCCKVSNKIFLKMMRVELVRMKNIERWEDYVGQVLFDLYGIRLGAGVYELQDHSCPTETLDRRTTLAISDRVISLANSMPMKDLLKSDLRPTIEKMQQAIGAAKSTPQMQHNLRNYTEYLKSSIHPLHMIEALKGKVYVDSVPVVTPESPLADKGWYFLLGMMALTRFRSQKRLSPGATDDLKVAATFFKLQLQHTSELWETWYRLAQCFDAELEEDILWSAEKLNTDRGPLTQLQRSSIHCYTMALSAAMRSADASLETASKISDMYHDFGARIYSSSREPFRMEVFYVDEFERHFSGYQGMYKQRSHSEMSAFKAWRYGATLFQRALRDMPNNWMSYFLLGKCLWKMYTRYSEYESDRPKPVRPSMASVINAFAKAIEVVPKPNRSEPIIEPHYKLMSIAHKLVMMGDLDYQEAANLLQRQPFAIRKGESIVLSDPGAWGAFILESLRHLRNADKSNWHHRMIHRVARIQCPNAAPTYLEASNALIELRISMFTKTMVVQVWKPEFERPGRHCVYMNRYVTFMTRLLWLLEDKLSMEALVKRVRKKQIDYYNFAEVWTECCNTYIRLLRRAGSVSLNQDESLKAFPADEFSSISDALEAWCNDPESSHPALDCLREGFELKKLNANLMKSGLIDDLLNDAWATLVLQVGVTLPRVAPPLPPSPTNEPRSQGPMSLNNLVSNMDGAGVAQVPLVTEPAGRPRNKGVSRREILRRAEGAIARTTEAPRPFSASRSRVSDQPLLLNSNNKSPVVGTVQPRAAAALREEESHEVGGESSAPGSVHDSADDESDLSDVPDLEEEHPTNVSTQQGNTSAEGSEGGNRSAEAAAREGDFGRER